MPERGLLREAAAWVVDLAVFCDVVRPALFRIAEFVVSSGGSGGGGVAGAAPPRGLARAS